MILGLKKSSEYLILAIACLAPWAFGSVDAWAGLVLGAAIVVLAVASLIASWNSNRLRAILCVPSLALGGLVLLSVFQTVPLSSRWFQTLAPEEAAFRSTLAPPESERVIAAEFSPVDPPRSTLSQNPELTRSAACRLAGAWLLFQAVLCQQEPFALLRRFGIATAINACMLAFVSTVQWLSWNGKVLWIREAPRPETPWYSAGPFACHNQMAAYLNIGLGFALGWFFTANHGPRTYARRGAQLWPAYVTGVLIMGLLASHSRGAFVAGGTAFLLASFFSFRFARQDRLNHSSKYDYSHADWSGRWQVPAVLGGVMLAVICTLAITAGRSPFERLASLGDPGADMRWLVWKLSFLSWCDRPIWGAGLGCFAGAISPYEVRDYGVSYSRAENEYLDLLVEGGVIGLGLLLVGLGAGVWLVRRALIASRGQSEHRYLLLAAIYGAVSLLVHWFFDFSFHIPAVAISAIILGGLLCRVGLDSVGQTERAPTAPHPGLGMARLFAVASLGVGLICIVPTYGDARAELILYQAGLALPDASRANDRWQERSAVEVKAGLAALEQALAERPNWTEGHLRRGMALLRLYELGALDLLEEEVEDKKEAQLFSQPLWLREQVYQGSIERKIPVESLLEQEPIRSGLIPAARSFLEARRTSPVSANAQVQLASVDYLVEPSKLSESSASRAVRLAGANRYILELASVMATQNGDLKLASQCWKRLLQVEHLFWDRVAEAAGRVLSPGAILSDVIPADQGKVIVQFADLLYSKNHRKEAKQQFLREALARLPNEELEPAERLYFQASAHAGLEENTQAQRLLEQALVLDPRQTHWRMRLINLLIETKQWKPAKLQIAVGLEVEPGHPDLLNAQQRVLDAQSRGETSNPRPNGAQHKVAGARE